MNQKPLHLRIVLVFLVTIILSTSSITVLFGISETPQSEISHVLLIVIDDVRPDILQIVDTPNLDSLISEGSYTYNAWTVTPSNTKAAIPAILTGSNPETHQLQEWSDTLQAETIVEVLEEANYRSALVGESVNIGGYAAARARARSATLP